MTAMLTFRDQRPGSAKGIARQLQLTSNRITARELVRHRIEADIEADFANRRSAWLVTPGDTERALNGERGPYVQFDVDAYTEVAFQAFERNGFFMIFDGRQVTDLDEVLTVERDSALTFVRLVPMVGG
jgi:hypothetical protein